MGILRTDQVSGLGGANAITGSAFFAGGKATTTSSDYNLGTDDFTIECFVYFSGKHATLSTIFETRSSTSASDGFLLGRFQTSGHENKVELYTASDYRVTADRTVENDTWVHIAVVRASATTKVYVDGTAYSSTYSDSNNYSNTEIIFGKNAPNSDQYQLTGFISNFHVVKGTAIYTANFTPPTNQIQKRSDTVFLGFQSASDVTREETGKIITFPVSGHNSVSHGPDTSKSVISSRFTPNSPVGFSTTTDVGTQFGSTFDGVTTFDSQAYMVVPSGNTRERNRGRGVLGGGAPYVSPSVIGNMSFVEVQSQGNFQDFGDLTVSRGNMVSGQNSSSTRGLSSGGWTNPTGVNTIDFITIANTANAIDFGDTTITRPNGGLSNQTRSLTASSGDLINTIDFVTIATTGNASDFGDLLDARGLVSGVSSPTRGVFGGGRNNTPSSNTEYNTLQFITIASTGNAQDFGDLTRTHYGMSGFSSATRGIFAGGYSNPQGKINSIEFFTIATLGNAIDFGDLGASQGYGGSLTNSIFGLITINNPSNYYNTIEFITISTTGNAKDFGDADPLGSGKGHGSFPSCMSDSHGGTT